MGELRKNNLRNAQFEQKMTEKNIVVMFCCEKEMYLKTVSLLTILPPYKTLKLIHEADHSPGR